jgi:hypothetical protein
MPDIGPGICFEPQSLFSGTPSGKKGEKNIQLVFLKETEVVLLTRIQGAY